MSPCFTELLNSFLSHTECGFNGRNIKVLKISIVGGETAAATPSEEDCQSTQRSELLFSEETRPRNQPGNLKCPSKEINYDGGKGSKYNSYLFGETSCVCSDKVIELKVQWTMFPLEQLQQKLDETSVSNSWMFGSFNIFKLTLFMKQQLLMFFCFVFSPTD